MCHVSILQPRARDGLRRGAVSGRRAASRGVRRRQPHARRRAARAPTEQSRPNLAPPSSPFADAPARLLPCAALSSAQWRKLFEYSYERGCAQLWTRREHGMRNIGHARSSVRRHARVPRCAPLQAAHRAADARDQRREATPVARAVRRVGVSRGSGFDRARIYDRCEPSEPPRAALAAAHECRRCVRHRYHSAPASEAWRRSRSRGPRCRHSRRTHTRQTCTSAAHRTDRCHHLHIRPAAPQRQWKCSARVRCA